MPKVKCKTCSEYVERDEAIRMGIQSFCSTEHAYVQPKRKTPKKDKSMPPDIYEQVMVADARRCRYCGGRANLHVHHIRYRSEGGPHEIGNLITLCKEHHDLVHSNKKQYQPLCLEIVAIRAKGDAFALIANRKGHV